MDKEAREAFESRFKNARVIWFAITGLGIASVFAVWISKPTAFDVTFSRPFVDDNLVFVLILALISMSTLWSLRKKSEFASFVLDLRDTDKLAIGFLYPPMLALSITCWGLFLALYFEYAYAFLWIAVGLISACYVFPRRARYEQIFQRVNADHLNA